MTEKISTVRCRAGVHEDDRAFTLQIELLDQRSVCLNFWKDGYVSVAIWTGNGEHDLVDNNGDTGDSLSSFKEWAEIAVGKNPSSHVGPYYDGIEGGIIDPNSDEVTPRRSIR